MITSVRNWCYDLGIFKSTSFKIPIISVGNLAVGGSGKTPMVEYLISTLSNQYNIATLSRGYGRNTTGFLWVESQSSATQVGDEPLQIKSKFNAIAVAVCENRVDGVQRILSDKPNTQIILLDDAFQHRAICPSIQLLLSSYSSPFYKDWLMPVGRLRERRQGAERADAIIYTKCPNNYRSTPWRDKPTFYSSIRYQSIDIEHSIFGFSALADNTPFKNYLKERYHLVGFKGFRDHYNFVQKDLDSLILKAKNATLICTEKDWMKVKDLDGSEHIRYISITNTIEGDVDFISWLKQKINLDDIQDHNDHTDRI